MPGFYEDYKNVRQKVKVGEQEDVYRVLQKKYFKEKSSFVSLKIVRAIQFISNMLSFLLLMCVTVSGTVIFSESPCM